MDQQFTRQVTVVIGAGSGIGRATATALAAGGHTVVAVDRDREAVDEVAGALDVMSQVADVTDEASVAAMFDAVVQRFGAPTGVVNCAGVSTLAPLVEHDVAEFRRVVDVCLSGAMVVLKHAGRSVEDGASLVNVASLNARRPGTGMAAYCAAKAGLLMLTQVAALELAPRRVRVNAVSPGLVVTPLTAPAMDLPGIPEAYLENTPLGRNGTPDEVAATIRFLLSADSTWITGEDIQLDGGSHLMRYPDLHGLVMAALV